MHGEIDRDLATASRQWLYFASLLGSYSAAAAAERRLRESAVLVVGVGGGAHVAQGLIQAGLGKLLISDDDRIDRTNLTRHALATEEDVGRLKVDVVQDYAKRMGGDTEVVSIPSRLTAQEDFVQTMDQADVAVVTTGNPPLDLRAVSSRAALATGTPVIYYGAWSIGPFVQPGRSACWECFEDEFRRVDHDWDLVAHGQVPSMPTPNFVAFASLPGALVVNEVVMHLTGIARPATLGRICHLEPSTLNMMHMNCDTRCHHQRARG